LRFKLLVLLLLPLAFGCATGKESKTVREFDLTHNPTYYDRAPFRVCPPIAPGFSNYCTP